jgi:hypothetical protein
MATNQNKVQCDVEQYVTIQPGVGQADSFPFSPAGDRSRRSKLVVGDATRMPTRPLWFKHPTHRSAALRAAGMTGFQGRHRQRALTSADHRIARIAQRQFGRYVPKLPSDCQENRWPRLAQLAKRGTNFPTRARLHTVREIGKERWIRWWRVGQAARWAATQFQGMSRTSSSLSIV